MANDPTWMTDGYTPRRNATQLETLQKILGATIDLAGGGGGGAVGAIGNNYKFEGSSPNQVFVLSNLTTGQFNQINTVGATGSQSIIVQPGVP